MTMREKKLLLTLFFILLAVLGPAAGHCADPIQRILLIGNSYTYGNDLDKLLEHVARSMGENVEVRRATKSGYTLHQHLDDCDTLDLLNSRHWDVVVLQEHSLVPTQYKIRRQTMYPAVAEFKKRIEAQHGQPLLMMTWGRREQTSATIEGRHLRFMDYDSMQNDLRDGYEIAATRFDLPVAPVGLAWRSVRKHFPEVNLYIKDGSHPNINGSYLASLVLYSAIFRRCPFEVQYHPPEIDDDTAHKLRQAANWFFFYVPHAPPGMVR